MNAFIKAEENDPEFVLRFKSAKNAMESPNFGPAARHVQINWFDGTKNKLVDSLYIIGEKDKTLCYENHTIKNVRRVVSNRANQISRCDRLLNKFYQQ
jgi:hypothetical protein